VSERRLRRFKTKGLSSVLARHATAHIHTAAEASVAPRITAVENDGLDFPEKKSMVPPARGVRAMRAILGALVLAATVSGMAQEDVGVVEISALQEVPPPWL
jgi:GTP-sensing pleiotropic transcriptional regulator CodY